MMPFDRMPSISLGVIVPAGASYDTHHWPNDAGVWHASVRFDAGGYSSGHLQGSPAALRELAAALIDAADQADAARPRPLRWWRGWPSDVGRQPRLPRLRERLACPLPLARAGRRRRRRAGRALL